VNGEISPLELVGPQAGYWVFKRKRNSIKKIGYDYLMSIKTMLEEDSLASFMCTLLNLEKKISKRYGLK
jgi:hypothetical protein